MTAAAAASISPRLRNLVGLDWLRSRSASTVENLSSAVITGTGEHSSSFRANMVTDLVCALCSPLSEMGRPTTISPASSRSRTSRIASMEAASDLRSIVVRGDARMPKGSLTATPIRLFPTSSASILNLGPSALLRGWARDRARRPAWMRLGLRPARYRVVRHRRRRLPWLRLERSWKRQVPTSEGRV